MMKNEVKSKVLHKEASLQLICSECNEPIDNADVSIGDSIAKCKNCESIFTLDETEFEKRRSGHPIFLVPDGTEILKLITSLEISTSWLRSSKKDKIKFDFIMTSFFGTFSAMGFGVGIMTASLFLILISSFFVLISVFLTYLFIGNLVNKTYIKISEDALTIYHKPLKFVSWKEHNIPLASIQQLFVKEYQTNRSVNNVPLKAFGLYLKKKNEKTMKIMEDMNRETSLYVEQEIEEFLNISDKRMKGEILKTSKDSE